MRIKVITEKYPALSFGLMSIYIYITELSEFLPLFFIRVCIYPLIYFIGILSYINCIKKRKRNLLTLIILLSVLLFSVLIFPQGIQYLINVNETSTIFLSDLFLLLFVSFPIFLTCLSITDLNKFINQLNKIGFLVIVLFVITFTIKVFIYHYTFDYMNITYGVLPWVLLELIYIKDSKKNSIKKIRILFTLLALIYIAISGCRGALLTAFVFILLYFTAIQHNRITLKKIIIFFVCLIIFILIIINLNYIMLNLYNYFNSLGFKSRIFELYLGIGLEQGIGHYSDRADVQIPMLEKLNIFGYGLFGDRVMSETNQYAHNLFLEWLVDFGIVIGGILIILFVIIIIKSIFILYKTKDNDKKILLALTISFLCCKYMISSSYLHSPEFWLYIGILISINKKIKVRSE